MIAIIVADANELFLDELLVKSKKRSGQFQLFYFNWQGKECVLVHSRIGSANAAAAMQLLITRHELAMVYNYGAVGGSVNVRIYDLITPARIFYHDVSTPWYDRGTVPGEMPYYQNAIQLKDTSNLGTGSSFVTSKSYWSKLKTELDVDIVDMEAAAIAQIASHHRLSLRVVKCVSDTIGLNEQNLPNLNARIRKASYKAFQAVLRIIAADEKTNPNAL